MVGGRVGTAALSTTTNLARRDAVNLFFKFALSPLRATFTNLPANAGVPAKICRARQRRFPRIWWSQNFAVQMAQQLQIGIVPSRTHQPNANQPFACFTSNQGGLILKSSLQIIAMVACVFSLAGHLQAQDNSGMVAVLDVAKVFEANAVFNQRMDAIKAEAQSFKAEMEQEQAALQQKAEKLKDYKPGAPEFNSLQAQLEQETAALRTRAQQTNTDLLNREARIYYETYTKMQETVAAIAGQYNITLIIRFDSRPIDPDNRAEVIQGVNRNIVYQKQLDLTSMVVDKMATASSANASDALNR
jgi:Skp family chaperone for outer membrane proteins